MTRLRRTAGLLRSAFGKQFVQLREINRRYKTPHVKMTPAVKFALLCLRLYLFLLVGLLVYKFYTLIASSR